MTRCIHSLSPDLFPPCRDFLLAHEYCCVSLMAAFMEFQPAHFPKSQRNSFAVLTAQPEKGASVIEGLVYLTPGGTLLHLLDLSVLEGDYIEPLFAWLRNKRIFCILGTATETNFLEALVARDISRAVDYELMTLDREQPQQAAVLPALSTGDHASGTDPYIRRVYPDDAKILLPLQMGYEQEEVLAPGSCPNEKRCYTLFKMALARQYVYAAFYGDIPVAKAGTNACGVYWDQLGGIYTKPELRANGIASALVAHVVHERTENGKSVVLFVKTDNVSAKKAYTKNGFITRYPFRIAYY